MGAFRSPLNRYLPSGGAPAVPILDLLTSAVAVGAWNLHWRMRAAYTGPLFRVRNWTTDVETDIYPLADGTVDLDTLETACGGPSSFVDCGIAVVYDQSGGGFDLAQATEAKQPMICDAGVGLITAGTQGLLAMRFTILADSRLTRADACGLSGDVEVGIDLLLSSPGTVGSNFCHVGGGSGSVRMESASSTPLIPRLGTDAGAFRHFATTGAYVDLSTYQHNSAYRDSGMDINATPRYANGAALTGGGSTSDIPTIDGALTAWGGRDFFANHTTEMLSGALVVWSTYPRTTEFTAFNAWMAAQT